MSSCADIADKCVNGNDFITEKEAHIVHPVFNYILIYLPLSQIQPTKFFYENKLPAIRQSPADNCIWLYQGGDEQSSCC